MTLDITIHGMDESDLNETEKELLAYKVHHLMVEDFGEMVDGVDVEGYFDE